MRPAYVMCFTAKAFETPAVHAWYRAQMRRRRWYCVIVELGAVTIGSALAWWAF